MRALTVRLGPRAPCITFLYDIAWLCISARAPPVHTRARAAAAARVMNLGTDLYEDLYEKLSDLAP